MEHPAKKTRVEGNETTPLGPQGDTDTQPSSTTYVWTLHHACRSGKSLLAAYALLGAYHWQKLTLLREHQHKTLLRMSQKSPFAHCHPVGVLKTPTPVMSMMVFSSLVVLQQFVAQYLQERSLPRHYKVVQVCSVGDHTASLDRVLVARMRTCRQKRRPIVLVTTYNSMGKISAALEQLAKSGVEAKECRVDMAVFDEAHNLHTSRNYQLLGVEEETRCNPVVLDRFYPNRLFLTATPREQMLQPTYEPIYGSPDEDWDVYAYADLLQWQRQNPTKEAMVKPLRVRLMVGGVSEQMRQRDEVLHPERTPEFYDIVAVVREISERLETGEPTAFVKVYHKRAHEAGDGLDERQVEQGKRSAEHFVAASRWQGAVEYLHERNEALNLAWRDLDVRNIDGSMADSQRSSTLDWFNEAAVPGAPIRVLLSCQVFREGVTLNRVDLTVFADGKSSIREIVQSGLRGAKADKAHKNQPLDILLLVTADGASLDPGRMQEKKSPQAHEAIMEALLSRVNFAAVCVTLNALMELDPAVRASLMEQAAHFSGNREAVPTKGKDQLPNKGSEHPPVGVRAAWTCKIQPELAFDWDHSTFTQVGACLLHSAAVRLSYKPLTQVQKAQDLVDHVQGQLQTTGKVNIPSQRDMSIRFSDRTCMGSWWSKATSKGGYIEREEQVRVIIEKCPELWQRYSQLQEKRNEKPSVVPLTQVQKAQDLVDYVQGQLQTTGKANIPSTHNKSITFSDGVCMGKWWSHATKKGGCIEREEKVRVIIEKCPGLWQRYSQRQEKRGQKRPLEAPHKKPHKKMKKKSPPMTIPQLMELRNGTLMTNERILKSNSGECEDMSEQQSQNLKSINEECIDSSEQQRPPPGNEGPAKHTSSKCKLKSFAPEGEALRYGAQLPPRSHQPVVVRKTGTVPMEGYEYGETHTSEHRQWKTEMNDAFGRALVGSSGRILVLDDDEYPAFGTSRRLVEKYGILVSRLCIVQADWDKVRAMRADKVYGAQVVHGYVQDYLRQQGPEKVRYAGVYLDLCGTWIGQLKPALEALLDQLPRHPEGSELSSSLILGVTWCTRSAHGQTGVEVDAEMFLLLSRTVHQKMLRNSLFGSMRTRFFKILY